MAKLELTLANLEHLDFGKLNAAFTRALRRAVDDCDDRAGDPSVRTVTLTFTITPVPDEHNDLDGVNVQGKVTTKVPPRTSQIYRMQARRTDRGTQLVFDDLSTDARQGSLADAEDETTEGDES